MLKEYTPNRERVLDAVLRLEAAKTTLEEMLPNEHSFVNEEVSAYCSDVQKHNWNAGRPTQEDLEVRGLHLADMVLTHILHVNGEDQYIRGYYQKFIADPTNDFETRLDYVDATVQLLASTGTIDEDNGILSRWSLAKNGVLEARKVVKSGGYSEEDTATCVDASYEVVENFRRTLVDLRYKKEGVYVEQPREGRRAGKERTKKRRERIGAAREEHLRREREEI